jgi:hypothetical protein
MPRDVVAQEGWANRIIVRLSIRDYRIAERVPVEDGEPFYEVERDVFASFDNALRAARVLYPRDFPK